MAFPLSFSVSYYFREFMLQNIYNTDPSIDNFLLLNVIKDIVVLLEDQLKPLVQAEISVLVDILHHPEYLFDRGSEGRRKCESGGFISK